MTDIHDFKSLEQRLSIIEKRNSKVEIDKAWEGSITRRIVIVFFTFFSIGLYMWWIGVQDPLLNAVIPSLGFTLSTLSLPYIKQIWLKF